MSMATDSETITAYDPYRRELLAHCYRMLGSAHDAEDAVQETLLRAWRSQDGFEHRSSLRVWLYRIATNACLRSLERRGRLPLPSGLGGPNQDAEAGIGPILPELSWLEPIPDSLLGGSQQADDPASAVVTRESVRLAFICALQHLPARQRAVLILREVLAFSARETAEVLETSVASANSALQRARARIAAVSPAQDDMVEPDEPALKDRLDRYLTAFEAADIATLLGLFRADIVLEMPPLPAWFAGRDAVGAFIAGQVLTTPGLFRLVPIEANFQPGFAAYLIGEDGAYHAHGISVLTLTPAGVCRIVVFLDASLYPVFGLPLTLR